MQPSATLMWWDGYKWWVPVFNYCENCIMFFDTGVGLPRECEARFKFNPNAEEFIPGGGRCSDNQCPTDDEEQVTQDSPLFFSSNLSTISEGDESGYDYVDNSDDSDDSDGGLIVTIGPRSEGYHSEAVIASSPKSDSGSSGVGTSELNPEAEEFIPRYWNQVYWNKDSSTEKSDGEAEKSNFTCHHQEFLIGVENRCPPQPPVEEEPKCRPQEQVHSSWELRPNVAGNDLNGEVIPMYRVDTSQAMQIEGLGASTFDYISSGPSKDGIPVLVTPEIHNVSASLAKLPEPFRVVHPTPDTPVTRVYALGGFELASPFPPTPNAVPKLSIDAYLALNPRQQQGYKPSYGLIGFGTDPSLSPPSFSDKFNVASHVNSSTEDYGGDLPSYDLMYGAVGYVHVPN